MNGLENMSSEEHLRELTLFSLRKRRLMLIALYSCLKGNCHEAGVGFFCHVSSERMRGNYLKLCQQRFRLELRNFIFTAEVVRHWNELSRKVVEVPSLEGLKRHLDMHLGLGVIKMVLC